MLEIRNIRRVAKLVPRAAAKFLVKKFIAYRWVRVAYGTAKNISSKTIHPIIPKFHKLFFIKLKLYLRKQYLHRDRSSRIFVPKSKNLYGTIKPVPPEFLPKVSVIVPSHHQADFLRERLNSIYKQTYSNYEVILLDGAFADESREIFLEFKNRYKGITRHVSNTYHSESTYPGWGSSITLARGDLIWIAEGNSYSSENLLTELIKYFFNEAVMLAYCRTVFVDDESNDSYKGFAELNTELWRDSSIISAHRLVNNAWATRNIIPSASSVIFRHPGRLPLLDDENWKNMKIYGDWVFFLHIARGGLVSYSSLATSYLRPSSITYADVYDKEICYQEREKVARELVTLYQIESNVRERQCQHYDYNIECFSAVRKPNLLMVSYALTAGGGETFPIKLANMLKSAGYAITFLNCHKADTESGVRQMLQRDIPLLELDTLEKLSAVVNDMAIEIVHTHHVWVDVCVCYFLEDNHSSQLVVTTHGIYEMTHSVELAQIFPLLKKRVDKFIYLADKNLSAFASAHFDMKRFVRIDNAVDIVAITPVPRSELAVPEDAFLICLVSRAIPEKGWHEAIEVVKLAREISRENIHLLLVGAGPEYDRLKPIVKEDFVHLLGFRANVRDYFATSDLGFLPSRYLGESFPLVLIECLHANRPILASNLGEIKRMISTSTGPAGTVFDLHDWEIPIPTVAKIIVEYVEDKEMYCEHLGCVPTAAAKFDPTVLLKKYESVYMELYNPQPSAHMN